LSAAATCPRSSPSTCTVAMAAALPDGDEKQHDRGDDRYQDDGVVGIAFHGLAAPALR
jgi:hypothetical protein